MVTYFPVIYYASLFFFFLKLKYVQYILNFGLLGSDAMQPVDGHHLFWRTCNVHFKGGRRTKLHDIMIQMAKFNIFTTIKI